MNKKGCSTTNNGMEEWERFQTRGRIFFQYDYRTKDGHLFSCVGPSLENCRIRRDCWLDKEGHSEA